MKLVKATNNIITALKPAVRDSRRVNVFVDEEFDFSLDLAQVVDYGVKVGQVLSDERLEELRHASDFGKLYQRTLEYVLMRPRSIKEVRDHLVQRQKNRAFQAKKYTELQMKKAGDQVFKRATIRSEDIERVIARLEEKGYLDDKKFAEYFVENRNTVKGTSRKKLRLELMKKGIEVKIIDEVLESSSRNDTEEIQKIIAKKRRRGYDEQKLIQYLMRQGFDFELAKAALRETD